MEFGKEDQSSEDDCQGRQSLFLLPGISIEKDVSPQTPINLLTSEVGYGDNEKVDSKNAGEQTVKAKREGSESHAFRNRLSLSHSFSSFDAPNKLDAAKAVELEQRLKSLSHAFTERTARAKKKIRQPPTPSSDESDSEPSTTGEPNLMNRLQALLPSSSDSSVFGEDDRRKSISQKLIGTCQNKLRFLLQIARCKYCLDPQSSVYVSWLVILCVFLLYNAWVIPLRIVFPYQTSENENIWMIADLIADVFYLIDMVAFKSHKKFIQNGFWVKDPSETRLSYLRSLQFKVDLISLFPADIISALLYQNIPALRIPRLLKIESFWELFRRFDTVLASPHSARIARTIIHMLYLIHLMACAYYALSAWQGLGTTTWTFDNKGNAYIRCFYFATKTATSIGKNPKPEKEIEYLFMTFAWLSGVFVFALLIGQIRDIIATATKSQEEYREMTYKTATYLHRLGVPKHLEDRVKLWLTYTWTQQKTLDEGKILDLLPHRMRTDIALNLHVETLSKVKLFQNCEVAFLRDLVIKLRSIIFLPGDYICRKGEVGKTMYIVKSGRIDVVGGPDNSKIFATLTEGSVFGEIALLAIGGMNKRTADVRSAGFSNLFVLSKDDLSQTIKDYPEAQEIMKKKAKKLMKESAKKAKAAAEPQIIKNGESDTSSSTDLPLTAEVIIQNKEEPPKLIQTVMQAISPTSKASRYLTLGSKATSLTNVGNEEEMTSMTSYPPTPFIDKSIGTVDQEADRCWSSSSSEALLQKLSSNLKDFTNITTSDGIVNTDELEGIPGAGASSLIKGATVPLGDKEGNDGNTMASERVNDFVTKEKAPEDFSENILTRVVSVVDRESLPVHLRQPVYPIIPETTQMHSLDVTVYHSVDETTNLLLFGIDPEEIPSPKVKRETAALLVRNESSLHRQFSIDVAETVDIENSNNSRENETFEDNPEEQLDFQGMDPNCRGIMDISIDRDIV